MENNQENRELVLIKDLGYLYPNENSKQKRRYAIYKCNCGVEFKAMYDLVKRKHTTSCGCYQKKRVLEAKRTHGLTKHKIYNVWNHIMGRCFNKNNKSFNDYGGRGITVCDRWLKVENFISDMYPSHKDGLSIDRINNDGNYEPNNCRWATNEVQQRNTRIIRKRNKTGYRGVYFNESRNKFSSSIRVNSKSIHLGYFHNAIDGAKAYNKYVIDNNLEHTLNIV